jgi:hypothetical protein
MNSTVPETEGIPMEDDRLHLLDKGFETGEVVVANQHNHWLVSTFKTCEVTPDTHLAYMRALSARWNAVADALAEYDNPHKSITRQSVAHARSRTHNGTSCARCAQGSTGSQGTRRDRAGDG